LAKRAYYLHHHRSPSWRNGLTVINITAEVGQTGLYYHHHHSPSWPNGLTIIITAEVNQTGLLSTSSSYLEEFVDILLAHNEGAHSPSWPNGHIIVVMISTTSYRITHTSYLAPVSKLKLDAKWAHCDHHHHTDCSLPHTAEDTN
jgi:hypothetical protein